MKKPLRPRYSGPKSTKFWERINALPQRHYEEAYRLGVVLQETEATALRLLNNLMK